MSDTLVDLLGSFLEQPLADRSSESATGLALATLKGSRDENQDRALAVHVRRAAPGPKEFVVLTLGDGMGGMFDGGGAATVAVAEFAAAIVEGFDGSLEAVEDAAHNANIGVFERYAGKGGATLVAAVFCADGSVFTAHCGDSRLYLAGRDRPLALLTRDDTVAGRTAGADLECDMDNRLLTFAGVGDEFAPTISKRRGVPGALWLLTSDGAHLVGRETISRIVEGDDRAEDITDRLLSVAMALGAPDNATAIAFSPELFLAAGVNSGSSELTVWTPSEVFKLGAAT